MSEAIRVAVRIRDLLPREREAGQEALWQWDAASHRIWAAGGAKLFAFDRVFTPAEANERVYDGLIRGSIESVVQGFNTTVFAYGQTASGKTHTMLGQPSDPGLIRRSVESIFERIGQMSSTREFLMRVAYLEIYNEQVNDLFVEPKKRKKVNIREDANGNTVFENLEEIPIGAMEDIFTLMEMGQQHRRVGETNMNERSSRSHTILRLVVESSTTEVDEDGEEASGTAITVSNLNLVDLAGSERANQTGAMGERLREGNNINKSLLVLGQVISKLSEGTKDHIPFRDSKLTRILKDSLGGNAKTTIICTITPAEKDQTKSTLEFASRAKTIVQHVHKNEYLDNGAEMVRLKKEIKALSEALEMEREKKVVEEQRKGQDEELKEIELKRVHLLQDMRDKILKNSEAKLDVVQKNRAKEDFKRRQSWHPAALNQKRMSLGLALKAPQIDEEFHLRMESLCLNKTGTRSSPSGSLSPKGSSSLHELSNPLDSESFSEEMNAFHENEYSKMDLLQQSMTCDALDLSILDENDMQVPSLITDRRKLRVRFNENPTKSVQIRRKSQFLQPPMSPMMHALDLEVQGTPRDVLKDRLKLKDDTIKELAHEFKELQEFTRIEAQVLDEERRSIETKAVQDMRKGFNTLKHEKTFLEERLKDMVTEKERVEERLRFLQEENEQFWVAKYQGDKVKRRETELISIQEEPDENQPSKHSEVLVNTISNLDEALVDIDALKSIIDGLQAELEREAARIIGIERGQEALQQERNTLATWRALHEPQVEAWSKSRETLEEPRDVSGFEAENATLKAENATLKAQNATFKAENETFKTENETFKAKPRDPVDQLDTDPICQSQLDEIMAQKEDVQRELEHSELDKMALRREIEGLRDSLDLGQVASSDLKAKLAELQEQNRILSSQLEASPVASVSKVRLHESPEEDSGKVQALEDRNGHLSTRLNELEAIHATTLLSNENVETQLEAAQCRVKELESLMEAREEINPTPSQLSIQAELEGLEAKSEVPSELIDTHDQTPSFSMRGEPPCSLVEAGEDISEQLESRVDALELQKADLLSKIALLEREHYPETIQKLESEHKALKAVIGAKEEIQAQLEDQVASLKISKTTDGIQREAEPEATNNALQALIKVHEEAKAQLEDEVTSLTAHKLDLESQIGAWEASEFPESLRRLEAENKTLETLVESIKADKVLLEDEIGSLRILKADLETKMSELETLESTKDDSRLEAKMNTIEADQVSEILHLKTQIDDLQSKVNDWEVLDYPQVIRQLHVEKKALEALVEANEARAMQLELEVSALNAQKAELASQVDALESSAHPEVIAQLEADKTTLASQLQAFAEAKAELEDEVQSLTLQKTDLFAKMIELEAEDYPGVIGRLEGDISALQAIMEANKAEKFEFENVVSSLTSQRDTLVKNLEASDAQTEAIYQVEASLAASEATRRDLATDLEAQETQVVKLESELRSMEAKTSNLLQGAQELEALQAHHQEVQAENESLKAQLHHLADLSAKFEVLQAELARTEAEKEVLAQKGYHGETLQEEVDGLKLKLKRAEKLDDLVRSLETQNNDLVEQVDELETIQTKYEQVMVENQDLAARLNQDSMAMSALKHEYEMEREELEEIKKKLLQAEQEASLRDPEQLQKLKSTLSRLEKLVKYLESQNSELIERLDELETSELPQLEANKTQLEAEVCSLQVRNEKMAERLQALEHLHAPEANVVGDLKNKLHEALIDNASLKVKVEREDMEFKRKCQILSDNLDFEKEEVRSLREKIRRVQREKMDSTILPLARGCSTPDLKANGIDAQTMTEEVGAESAPAQKLSDKEAFEQVMTKYEKGYWSQGSGVVKDYALDVAKARISELERQCSHYSAESGHYEGKAREWKKEALQLRHTMKRSKAASSNPAPLSAAGPSAAALEAKPVLMESHQDNITQGEGRAIKPDMRAQGSIEEDPDAELIRNFKLDFNKCDPDSFRNPSAKPLTTPKKTPMKRKLTTPMKENCKQQ